MNVVAAHGLNRASLQCLKLKLNVRRVALGGAFVTTTKERRRDCAQRRSNASINSPTGVWVRRCGCKRLHD